MEQDRAVIGSTGHENTGAACRHQPATLPALVCLSWRRKVNGKIGVALRQDTAATIKHADTDQANMATLSMVGSEKMAACGRGIFGQGIFIDPGRKLIIASNSNWPYATDRQGGDQGRKRLSFYRQVQMAIDNEAKALK
jgi:CubicO group peptidase (beta-lactamase class C family)